MPQVGFWHPPLATRPLRDTVQPVALQIQRLTLAKPAFFWKVFDFFSRVSKVYHR